jgi:hypothetical protein
MSHICDTCGGVIQIGDYPFCKGNPTNHVPANFGVVGDDIPGGIEIKHGICNPDGTPRRYHSKTEIRRAANEKGLKLAEDTPGKPYKVHWSGKEDAKSNQG